MDDTQKQALLSAARTLLASAGAALAAKGVISSGSANEIVGAVMVIVPLLWGMWDKYQAEKKAKSREMVAVQAGAIAATEGHLVTTPPAAISHDHAQEIIRTFAPNATDKG